MILIALPFFLLLDGSYVFSISDQKSYLQGAIPIFLPRYIPHEHSDTTVYFSLVTLVTIEIYICLCDFFFFWINVYLLSSRL